MGWNDTVGTRQVLYRWGTALTARDEAFLYVEEVTARRVTLGAWMIMARWACSVCDYEYVEEAGDPATGIPPGTLFEDLPDDWRCPRCSAGKEAFVRASEEEEMNEEDYL